VEEEREVRMLLHETDYLKRALAAYIRRSGVNFEQPDGIAWGVEKHEKEEYVVLRNARGTILAVYEIVHERIRRVSRDKDLPIALGGKRKSIVPRRARSPRRLFAKGASAR
jgi:hypothetical protein